MVAVLHDWGKPEGGPLKKSEYLASSLRGVPVYELDKKGVPHKRIGKVHRFVFHPHARRVIGFTVKRPDIALMAHRSDLFVALDSFEVEDGKLFITLTKAATGKAACKRLGVDWDECIMWQGMPLMTQDERRCGFVGDVLFETESGQVKKVVIDRGTTADVLLGCTELPIDLIKGFKLGVGDKLNNEEGEDFLRGAIIVAPEALEVGTEGGLAQKAGAASAVAANKASAVAQKAKPVAADVAQRANDAAGKAAHKAGEAVNDGAFRLGVQLSKTKGMFSSFKEEYRKAAHGGNEEGK